MQRFALWLLKKEQTGDNMKSNLGSRLQYEY